MTWNVKEPEEISAGACRRQSRPMELLVSRELQNRSIEKSLQSAHLALRGTFKYNAPRQALEILIEMRSAIRSVDKTGRKTVHTA